MASTSSAVPSTSSSSSRNLDIAPSELVAAWKKEGTFDALRKQLMSDFSTSDDKDELVKKLDEVLRELMAEALFARLGKKDRQLHLLNSIERQYPILRKTSSEVEQRLRASEAASSNKRTIVDGLQRTLKRMRGDQDEGEDQMAVDGKAGIRSADLPATSSAEPTTSISDIEAPRTVPETSPAASAPPADESEPPLAELATEGPAACDPAQPDVPSTVRIPSPEPVVSEVVK